MWVPPRLDPQEREVDRTCPALFQKDSTDSGAREGLTQTPGAPPCFAEREGAGLEPPVSLGAGSVVTPRLAQARWRAAAGWVVGWGPGPPHQGVATRPLPAGTGV